MVKKYLLLCEFVVLLCEFDLIHTSRITFCKPLNKYQEYYMKRHGIAYNTIHNPYDTNVLELLWSAVPSRETSLMEYRKKRNKDTN